MPKFKLIVSDTKTGKSQTLEIEDAKAQVMIGRRIGETVDGSTIDMKGKKFQITGGSDKDGFPMRGSIHGGIRIAAILTDGPGFHSGSRGERKRKMVRGDTITEDIYQINMKSLKTQEKKPKTKRSKKTQTKRSKKTQTKRSKKTQTKKSKDRSGEK